MNKAASLISLISAVGVGSLSTLLMSCSHSSSSSSSAVVLAEITPPVRAATPVGFASHSLHAAVHPRSLASSDIKSRFFTSGPTNIFNILSSIDSRIDDINSQASQTTATCLSQTPVAYNIMPQGQTIAMYGQCNETVSQTNPVSGDPSLIIWGKNDGKTYLYYAIGAERVGVIATPNAAQAGQYQIQAWIGLGYSNSQCGPGGWDTCSYGLMELQADSSTSSFELAVAGMGFGYCGAQLRSDGTNIYVTGSIDMGSTCNAIDTLCVLASDGTTTGTCGSSVTTFALTPIGRLSQAASSQAHTQTGVTTWAASAYPASPNLTFDGTSSDAIYFGPTSAPTGVGLFQ